MKNAKLTGLFAKNSKLSLCFLAAFLLVGCFNPITAIPPKSGNSVTNPFTVDIFIGKDGSARSVAGPDSAQIKGNIRNFMQLIVVDDTGNIVAYAEDRRLNEEDTEGVLSINSIAFGQNYRFLLLMGHWEHENYNYYDGTNDFRPPTLLAAGLKTQQVFGSETITVVMWPIVVDTVFSANDRNLTVAPVITNGNPVAVTLYPIDWDVLWTINRGATGNGFTDLIGRTTPLSNPDASLTGKIITQPIGTYTSGFNKIGTAGSVNFKLEYKPFTTDAWSTVNNNNIKSDFFNLIEGGPVWIIRNGVNDEPQNESTNFTKFGNEVNYNGNGAVRFVIAPKTPDDGSELEISNGVFVGPSTSTTPEITFTTDGYEDSAEVYYAVVEKGHTPDYSDYKPLGEDNTVEEGDHRETITLDTANGDYDVYVIIYKDGEVSDPIIINTKEGGLDTDYEWGIGRFIAVAYDSDNAAWSGDGGKTWTNAPMPRLANWRSVTYGDGVFVALSCTVDYYAVARSEDNGETWQEIYLPTLLPIPPTKSYDCWVDITYGDGVFLAISKYKFTRSQDGGKTWTEAALLPDAVKWWDEVGYGDGVFVVVNGVSDSAARSNDGGITWEMVSMPSSAVWGKVTYGNGVFVAICNNYDTAAAWSTDGGINWSPATLPSSNGWRNVAYGNGVFLAVSDNAVAKSVDNGETWEEVSLPSPAMSEYDYESRWFGLTYGDGLFVITAQNSGMMGEPGSNKALWSVDGGTTWTDATLSSSSEWYDLVYGVP